MLAVAFGEDGLSGDSSFYFSPFEVGSEENFQGLLKIWALSVCREYGLEEENPIKSLEEDEQEFPVGFWILTQESVDSIDSSMEGYESNSDSEDYKINRMYKTRCQKAAVKVVEIEGDSRLLDHS